MCWKNMYKHGHGKKELKEARKRRASWNNKNNLEQDTQAGSSWNNFVAFCTFLLVPRCSSFFLIVLRCFTPDRLLHPVSACTFCSSLLYLILFCLNFLLVLLTVHRCDNMISHWCKEGTENRLLASRWNHEP